MKRHTMEFLREKLTCASEQARWRGISRSPCAEFAVHKFFTDEGSFNAHASSRVAMPKGQARCSVTTLDLNNVPKAEDGSVDFAEDFLERLQT